MNWYKKTKVKTYMHLWTRCYLQERLFLVLYWANIDGVIVDRSLLKPLFHFVSDFMNFSKTVIYLCVLFTYMVVLIHFWLVV